MGGKDLGWAEKFLLHPASCSEAAAAKSRTLLSHVAGQVWSWGWPGCRSPTEKSSDDPWQVHGDVIHSVTLHSGQSLHVLQERISSAWDMASISPLVQTDQ